MKWDHKPLDRRPQQERASLVRLPAGATWRILCTATRFACRHQHWADGRTLPCTLPEMPCRWCAAGMGKWFTAFLGCWNLSRQCPQVLAVPEGTYKAVAAVLGEALDGGLRGHRLQLRRLGPSPRSAIAVEHLGREENPAEIPPKLHVPNILFRAWGIPLGGLAVVQPVPTS